MKETNTTAWFQSLEKALGKLAAIAAVVILLIFPLYVRDFYFDILNAKRANSPLVANIKDYEFLV